MLSVGGSDGSVVDWVSRLDEGSAGGVEGRGIVVLEVETRRVSLGMLFVLDFGVVDDIRVNFSFSRSRSRSSPANTDVTLPVFARGLVEGDCECDCNLSLDFVRF